MESESKSCNDVVEEGLGFILAWICILLRGISSRFRLRYGISSTSIYLALGIIS